MQTHALTHTLMHISLPSPSIRNSLSPLNKKKSVDTGVRGDAQIHLSLKGFWHPLGRKNLSLTLQEQLLMTGECCQVKKQLQTTEGSRLPDFENKCVPISAVARRGGP